MLDFICHQRPPTKVRAQKMLILLSMAICGQINVNGFFFSECVSDQKNLSTHSKAKNQSFLILEELFGVHLLIFLEFWSN